MASISLKNCQVCQSSAIQAVTQIKDHSITKETFELHKCTECGFLFTQNAPEESESGRYYQSEDYISHSNTSKGLVSRLYHVVRDIMLGRKFGLVNSLGSKKNLLDVGSGTGYFLNFMKQRGYATFGIEIDEKAREFSKKQFGLDVNTPEYLKNGGINQKFGYITLWHVLEHLYDPNAYLQTFYNLLEDDGHLIIAVPNHACFEAKYYGTYWAAYDVPRHLWHFTPETLEKIATRNRFKLITKKMMPFDPFYNSLLSEKYKNSTLGLIQGFTIGFVSYLKGLMDVNKSSSVIYVLKKV
jgi:2-polyprenyl-3-methyl-5-hydroxy-6-metoxy-1,4-benzoquinol methylase